MNKKILILITSLIWSSIYDSSKKIFTDITISDQYKLGMQRINKKKLPIYIQDDKYFKNKVFYSCNVNFEHFNSYKITKVLNTYNVKYKIFIPKGIGKEKIINKIKKIYFTILRSEFIFYLKNNINTIFNARFKIPIFYSTYLKIPIFNKKSVFITPYFKKKSNGFIFFSIPYYLNITKNYDITLNTNFSSKICNQLNLELRYFNNKNKGLIEFYLLHNNKKYHNDELKEKNINNFLIYFKYTGIKEKILSFNINYTKLSNLKYLNDIESKYFINSNEKYITQKLCINYNYKNFYTYLSSKNIKLFKHGITNIYSVTPQLDIIFYKKNIYPFNLKIISKIAKFNNISSNYPETLRLQIEKKINLELLKRCLILNTEAKLMITNFKQKNIEKYNIKNNKYINNNVKFILPHFKTEINIFFYRYRNYSSSYSIQTLEPRFQYLYIPYYNKNNIFIYKSKFINKYYKNIFFDKKYSNIDNIKSCNKLTSCFKTIIYDSSLNKKFIASVGKIYSLSKKIKNYNKKKLLFSGDINWYICNIFFIQSGIQYDSYNHILALGDATINIKINKNNIFKIHYRYLNKKNIKNKIINIKKKYKNNIDLTNVDITYNWKPIEKFSINGSYFYNFKSNNYNKKIFIIEYKNLCWSINIEYEKKIVLLNNNNKKNNNKILFKFELFGLNRFNYH